MRHSYMRKPLWDVLRVLSEIDFVVIAALTAKAYRLVLNTYESECRRIRQVTTDLDSLSSEERTSEKRTVRRQRTGYDPAPECKGENAARESQEPEGENCCGSGQAELTSRLWPRNEGNRNCTD